VREGDRLRAVSAAMMRMTYPTAQLMFGGVGRPKLGLALVPVTGFAAAMDAVRSNKQLGDAVTLFLERETALSGGGGEAAGAGAGAAAVASAAVAAGSAPQPEEQQQQQQQQQQESVFDSSLFDE
jgi:hypothetical protein